MITAENILAHEFVGLDVVLVGSTNKKVVGLSGRIINETKSMFTIDVGDGGWKMIPKEGRWRFAVGDGREVVVDGSRIAKRPFDRIGGRG